MKIPIFCSLVISTICFAMILVDSLTNRKTSLFGGSAGRTSVIYKPKMAFQPSTIDSTPLYQEKLATVYYSTKVDKKNSKKPRDVSKFGYAPTFTNSEYAKNPSWTGRNVPSDWTQYDTPLASQADLKRIRAQVAKFI